MTQKKTHQSKKANGVTKAATVRLANGLTGRTGAQEVQALYRIL